MITYVTYITDGFGGLVVSILATGTRVPVAVGFFGHPKNPQYAFLRKRNKIICPMSQLCGMSKIPSVLRKLRL
jgi:glycerate kinase